MTRDNNRPPKIAEAMFNLLTRYKEEYKYQESLRELYEIKAGEGRFRSDLWYWRQVLLAIPQFYVWTLFWSLAMFRNYLKVAWRSIQRQKGYSLLNIFGLAVGMACCILILLWVQDELSYDNFHENGDRIYRVLRHLRTENMVSDYAIMPNPLGPAIEETFPEVKNVARICRVRWPMMADGELFSRIDMCLADSSFFNIFSFNVLRGNVKTSLQDPSSLVITESMARKCFGDDDPMGRTITGLGVNYTVAAVVENVPRNSHIQFECVMPIKYHFAYQQNWTQTWRYATYVQFHENSHEGIIGNGFIEGRIADLIKENHPEGWRMDVGITLQPLKDVHLRTHFPEDEDYNVGKGSITYVYLFSLTAFCILLIACVNFMSLSTARSANRQKEIGMRKVVGARRADIIRQFFGESLLMAFAALLAALVLIGIALPAFNAFTGKAIPLQKLAEFRWILALTGIAVFTGLVAGSYPAVLLSSFIPAKVLKGTDGRSAKRGSGFRSVLVVGQFAFTTLLITASLVIYSQLNYIRDKDLGYDKECTLGFHSGSLRENYEAFRTELVRNPNVLNVTKSVAPNRIGMAYRETGDFSFPGRNPEDGVRLFYCNTDTNYLDTFGVRLAEGRFFNRAIASDSSNFLLNETAVKALGMESPVGTPFTFQGRRGIIIGVIEDFHSASLHSGIKPVIFYSTPGWNIYVKIHPENMNETLEYLRSVWEKHREGGPVVDLNYSFLDEAVAMMYVSEVSMSQVFRFFTALAVFISCLGLLGLASFMAEQRVKEIGIRKTLGAPFSSLLLLLFKTFIKWVLLANLIAVPIAWFSMNRWLGGFRYHTELRPEIFVVTGSLALVIVVISAGYQTVRAARANPVDSLRYE